MTYYGRYDFPVCCSACYLCLNNFFFSLVFCFVLFLIQLFTIVDTGCFFFLNWITQWKSIIFYCWSEKWKSTYSTGIWLSIRKEITIFSKSLYFDLDVVGSYTNLVMLLLHNLFIRIDSPTAYHRFEEG